MKIQNLFLTSLIFCGAQALAQLPSQPTDPQHPGSASYSYTLQRESFKHNGRAVDVFLPAEAKARGVKVPVVVFGHGQAIDVSAYEMTLEHLAKKGIAAIHPMFDTGFFDTDWKRMGSDYNNLTAAAIGKYADYIDEKRVVFAGHSKGGYVTLMAAGDPGLRNQPFTLKSVVLFAPAGYDANYLANMDPQIPVTLVWSDQDTIIKQSAVVEIYNKLPSYNKQWILVPSYSSLKADHFFPLSKSTFVGGRNGVSPFHFFATWKWLIGAAQDLQNKSPLSDPYLYGAETDDTGVNGLNHSITRSW